MEKKVCKCAICGEEFTGWGNNPYPVRTGEEDRCCDYCNSKFIIPFRIAMARFNREEYERIAEVLDGLDYKALNDIATIG